MDISWTHVFGFIVVIAILLAGWRAIRPDSFKRSTQRLRGRLNG